MHSIPNTVLKKLKQRKTDNSFRQLNNNSEKIDFSSNDYLGLAQSEEIHKKLLNSISKKPLLGSSGSRLLTGNSNEIESLELELTQFFKGESGLLFNSGYDANVGFFSTIPQKSDTILYDEYIHASIRDGIRLSFAKSFSIKHNDVSDLKQKLQIAQGNIYIAIESIYSMDGDEAPIKSIIEICKTVDNTYIIVDEAHSTGIYGDKGEGLTHQLGVENEIFARLHTFGKAMGAHGALWLIPSKIKEYLINFCRPFIYTTAMPFHNVQHIRASIWFIQNNTHLIDLLRKRIKQFSDSMNSHQIAGYSASTSPIQIIKITDNNRIKRISSLLNKKGFDIPPILSPTVPKGEERLRICIHSFNTLKDITDISSIIAEAVNEA